MRIKVLHDNSRTMIYYINKNNVVDKCQFECKTTNGKNQVRFITKKGRLKLGRTCLPEDTIFWTTKQEAQQYLDKLLRKEMKKNGFKNVHINE